MSSGNAAAMQLLLVPIVGFLSRKTPSPPSHSAAEGAHTTHTHLGGMHAVQANGVTSRTRPHKRKASLAKLSQQQLLLPLQSGV
jgi:hypothetical protein